MNSFLNRIFLALGISFMAPIIATGAPSSQIEAHSVVSSIKPIHSLVEAVLGDVGSSVLLIDGSASMHNYHLKPSQQRALSAASIVFFVDDNAETFLSKAFGSTTSKASLIALADDPALTLLKKRKGGRWQQHDHDEDRSENGEGDQHHGHGYDVDLHIWLDPQNAEFMVRRIEVELIKQFPSFSMELSENAQQVIDKLRSLDDILDRRMQPFGNRPFIVFHDAFGYFEKRYSLKGVGSVLIDTGLSPSVSQIRAIRKTIEDTSAVCVFSEPQFSEKVISVVIEGKNVNTARIDPLGSNIKAGRSLYFELMRNISEGFERCLVS